MFDAKKIKNEIVDWIKNYFCEASEDSCAVVGISGGKDSSVVAALCVEALGCDRVFGVLMPRGNQHDIEFSMELVKFLNIRHCVINIKNITDEIYAAMESAKITPVKQTLTNTPARVRMTTLYAVGSVLNGRVANTCNLSEDWVGYSTKFGDSAGDFSPLSSLTVTEVKEVGKELNLPSKFIDKIPEDGLSGLTDEENLGFSYEALDRYIRENVCEDKALKEKIDKLHINNLHKLRPMPSYEIKL